MLAAGVEPHIGDDGGALGISGEARLRIPRRGRDHLSAADSRQNGFSRPAASQSRKAAFFAGNEEKIQNGRQEGGSSFGPTLPGFQ
jgi:hypothetical protein